MADQVIESGSKEEPVATKGVAVTVRYMQEGSEPGEIISFVVGAKQAAPWVEEAVLGLGVGGVAKVAAGGGSGVNGEIALRVESVTVPSDGLPPDASRAECMAQAEATREAGNELYKHQDRTFKKLKEAVLMYNRALDWVRKAGGDAPFEVRVRQNLALCMKASNEWTQCSLQCDAIIALCQAHPGDAKALAKAYYRRGQAACELELYESSISDLRKALELDPENSAMAFEIAKIAARCEKILSKQRTQFAELYQNMPRSSVYQRFKDDSTEFERLAKAGTQSA